MAALSTIAAIGFGLAGALAKKPYQGSPTIHFAPAPPPDPAIEARKAAEQAQNAAAIMRRRQQGQTAPIPTAVTGPAGLPTPAPVQRKSLLGQ